MHSDKHNIIINKVATSHYSNYIDWFDMVYDTQYSFIFITSVYSERLRDIIVLVSTQA